MGFEGGHTEDRRLGRNPADLGGRIPWVCHPQSLRGEHLQLVFRKAKPKLLGGEVQLDWLHNGRHLEMEEVRVVDQVGHLALEVLKDRRRKVDIEGPDLGGRNYLRLRGGALQFVRSALVHQQAHNNRGPQLVFDPQGQLLGAFHEHIPKVKHFRMHHYFLQLLVGKLH